MGRWADGHAKKVSRERKTGRPARASGAKAFAQSPHGELGQVHGVDELPERGARTSTGDRCCTPRSEESTRPRRASPLLDSSQNP